MATPDFFTLYGLAQSFHPDAAAVRRQYYALSRQYHPDRATGEGSIDALRMSALVNDAYKTLTDADRTMGYILKLHSVISEEEQYTLPPDFLMDIMELNEAIGNAAMAPDMHADALREFSAAMDNWTQALSPLEARFDAGERSPELFAALKDFYYRKKYLLRIKTRLN